MAKSDVDKLITALRKDIGSNSFTESWMRVTEYISTGHMGLNRIISGDPINGGIPVGKVTLIGGESSSGKSMLVGSCVVNALKKDYKKVFICDSEGGSLYDYMESQEIDQDKIEEVPVYSVEDATVKMSTLLKALTEHKAANPEDKFLVVLDSLGGLQIDKVEKDAAAGKSTGDMGQTAKFKNQLVGMLKTYSMRANIPILITNHVYADPASFCVSKIMNQSGGKKAEFLPHVIIQSARKLEKTEDETEEQYYDATILKFFTTKNRIVKPFLECEAFISFSEGNTNKYYGLLESAIKYGFIVEDGEKKGKGYVIPTYKKGEKVKEAEILNSDEIWATFMEAYCAKCKDDLKYGSNIDVKDNPT